MVIREEQDKKVLFKAGHRTNHIQYKFYYYNKEDSQIRRTTNKLKLETIKILIDNNQIIYAKRYK